MRTERLFLFSQKVLLAKSKPQHWGTYFYFRTRPVAAIHAVHP
jgi:hypothetical protein